MPKAKKTICLVMIVKNEAAVIARCLEAVKPIISHYVICVTGSTDNTKQRIREVLKGISGKIHDAYYLAQSYRDIGDHAKALDWYEKRALMGGWEEEVWSALYQMGRMQQALGNDWRVVMQSYLQAYNYRPHRLEPLLPVARFYREHQQYRLGYLFSRPVIEAPYPDDTLFIEKRVYEHELLMEYGICCYWLRLHEESIRVNDQILLGTSAPENYQASAEQNRALSYAALMKERALATA